MKSDFEKSQIEKELAELAEQEFKLKAKSSLLGFTAYTFPEYEINWHHKRICQELDDFADGKTRLLALQMPPRHGKSELGSRRLPAYLFGRNPDIEIISTSYSDTLASRMALDV